MNQLTLATETCPVCSGTQTDAVETGWFALEWDRSAEIREGVQIEFRCRDCGSTWV